MQQVSIFLGSVITIYITLALYSLFQQIQQKRKNYALNYQLLKTRLETAVLRNSQEVEVKKLWKGVRKFVVSNKEQVARNVFTFTLIPCDRKPLPAFNPGEFLTFQLDIPGNLSKISRCYSISSAPNSESYKITIKRVEGGLVSQYFHDSVQENTILNVLAPSGQFCIEQESSKPLVLIAGGVGVTPFLSMLESCLISEQQREVYLFYSVRNPEDFINREYLISIAQANDGITCFYGVSQPADQNQNFNSDFNGHLSVDFLKSKLPSNNYEFYICGPDRMMNDLKQELYDWNVPKNSIHTEAFGPSSDTSSKSRNDQYTKLRTLNENESELLQISFSKSEKIEVWDFSENDLLKFIEKLDIPIETGCRNGNCGICETVIQSGSVRHMQPMNYPCKEGSCLPCISVPKTNLKLDL